MINNHRIAQKLSNVNSRQLTIFVLFCCYIANLDNSRAYWHDFRTSSDDRFDTGGEHANVDDKLSHILSVVSSLSPNAIPKLDLKESHL
jgi:hypothetical protein